MASILVVDDRPANRQFLVTLLGYSGHTLLEAENGAGALQLARAEHPDLVITDILMPVMDGYELARQLRQDRAFDNLPIIFYTATYQAREARALARAAGVQYVLTKPAEPQAILDLVNTALGRTPAPAPPTGIVTKPLLDPLQVVSQKLAVKMQELGGITARLSSLVELGIEIGGERDPQRLLEKFCESARQILSAQYAAVGILSRDGQSIQHFITSGMDPEAVARLGPPPTGKGLLGVLLNEHQAIRLRDLAADPRAGGFPPGHPLMRSFLGVPISTSLQAYGRLYLTEKIGAEEFSEEDERVAVTLAAQVAVAYENAQLYYDIQHHAAELQLEITERQKAEEALEASHRRFQSLVEHAPDGIALLGADGKLRQVTPSTQQILGYTLEEALGQDPAELTHPDDLVNLLALLNDLIQNPEKVFTAEYRFRHKDGSWRWLESTVTNLLAEPSVGAIVFNYRDVTERRRSAEQLNYHARLLKRINDAVIATDDQFRVTAWNRAAEKMYGWLSEEVLGHNIIDILGSELTEDQRLEARQLLKESHVSRGERIYASKDGKSICVDENTIILTDEHGRQSGYVSVHRDITERKRAEAERQQTEAKYRTLVEQLPAIIYISSPDQGTLLYISPQVEALGYSQAEWLSNDPPLWPKLVHPDDLARVMAEFMQNQILDRPAQSEYRLFARDGSLRWFRDEAQMVRGEFGQPVYLQGVMVDITERKRAEEQVRQSEENFSKAFSSSPTALMITRRADGQYLELNQAYTNIVGYDRAELLGNLTTEFNIYTYAEQRSEIVSLLLAQGALHNYEAQIRNKAGALRTVLASLELIQFNGEDAILTTLLDITERKQAEEKIERQLRHLSALRDIDIAISSSFDLHVTLEVVLRQVLTQLQVDAVAILLYQPQTQSLEYAGGQGFHSDALPHTRLKLGEGLASRAVIERKTIHIFDLRVMDSELPYDLRSASPGFVEYYATPLIVKGEVNGVLEVYHRTPLNSDKDWLDFLETLAGQAAIAIDNAQLFDRLQRLNAELEQRVVQRTAELHQLNLELQRANRAKDEFLATMSHELRTPLNSILGLSESLLEETRGPLNERQQEYLRLVESSGQHLLQLINDVLDLSKIEAGKFDYFPQVVDVDALCRSSLAFVREQAIRKSIRLVYTEAPSVTAIQADPRRMKQILVNLLTNAVKFTPDGGKVTLQVDTDEERELVQLSVSDTGIGIAPEDLQKLFQPFVQVDSSLSRQYEGTGLGLVLVQKMADVHGGSVEVESEVGRGSRFMINLPWTKEPRTLPQIPALGNQAPAQIHGPDPQDETIAHRRIVLLAEDNHANIMTVSEYLESHGYEVVVAHDGWEALAKAEESGPHIILMDIQLPALSGLEATRHLRENPRFASTPIIALTALAMPGDRERCLEAGATEYMSKPVRLKTLLETIHKLVGNDEP